MESHGANWEWESIKCTNYGKDNAKEALVFIYQCELISTARH